MSTVTDRMEERSVSDVLARVAAVLGALALLCFGVLGVGRGSAALGFDLNVLWTAGRTWLHGLDAYDPAVLSRTAPVGPFAYPPQVAPLCLLLALFPMGAAPWVGLVLNVFSFAAIDRSCQAIYAEASRPVSPPAGEPVAHNWWLTAVILGNPFSAHVVFMGQTSLIAVAAVLGSWQCAREKRPVLAGMLACVASIKPQISILVLVWFLLERRILVLVVFAGTVAVASVAPAIATGPLKLLPTWLHATRSYSSNFTNAVGFQHRFGVDSFLDAAGVHAFSFAWVALLVVVAMWVLRDRLASGEIVALLLATAVVFIFAHDYDLVALLPFAAAYAPLARQRRGALIVATAVFVLMSVPQRLLSAANSPLVNQFRVPVVLFAMGSWIAERARRWQSPRA
jgi:hypothetical protein